MNDDNLDLLDLDDNDSVDTLPDAPAFAAPRPKKPWLLLTVGLVVIVLATYVIIRAIGDDSSSSIDVDLDAPVVMVDGAGVPVDMNVMPPVKAEPVVVPQPVKVEPQPKAEAPQPKPVVQQPVVEQPQQTAGIPVRVIEERKEVKFEPAKAQPAEKPVAKSQPKPQPKPAAKPQPKPATYSWYVQFGSYSTRALAESAQKKISGAHRSLFDGKQFVILAAQLQNGTTTYRLRVGFNSAADANGFCRNAKSDGLDCYVAK